MAKCLVNKKISNVTCYDPSAGSGTLLMNLAHEIGQNKCTIYSQDISQKSSHLLRLNLILNNLVHSIQNIVKGNTILNPFHKSSDDNLQKFDFVVSNPPFNLDFSDYRNDLDNKDNNERFFAGIPNIPPKEKDSMGIYLLFMQHIIYSLKENGKAAVVVPTGFVTAKGIERKIREKLINEKMLAGAINMPSNIFAKTGTNVTVLFIDRNNNDKVTLIDASKLGTQIKVGKNKKTLLSNDDEEAIINTFLKKEAIEDFSVVLDYEEFPKKNFSFSPGQYFDVKIEHIDLDEKEFHSKINDFNKQLKSIFEESEQLNKEINTEIKKIKFD